MDEQTKMRVAEIPDELLKLPPGVLREPDFVVTPLGATPAFATVQTVSTAQSESDRRLTCRHKHAGNE